MKFARTVAAVARLGCAGVAQARFAWLEWAGGKAYAKSRHVCALTFNAAS